MSPSTQGLDLVGTGELSIRRCAGMSFCARPPKLDDDTILQRRNRGMILTPANRTTVVGNRQTPLLPCVCDHNDFHRAEKKS